MKILVPIKRVTDPNIKIRVKDDHSGVYLENIKGTINPFCEIAIEQAIRIKEADTGIEVITVSIGSKSCQEQLRFALALGVDRAIHIESDKDLDSLNIAKLLAKVVEEESPQMVILGKQSTDIESCQIGQMLAALTNFPQATFISKLSVEVDKVIATREIDGGQQLLALKLPAIITVDLGLNTPRYASLPNIMKARRKQLELRQDDSFGINLNPRTEILEVTSLNIQKECVIVNNVNELVDKLRNEAGVIL